ncbi:transcription regulator HTH, apses-type DNA-binding domain-containing protein, partial [Russula compacta]
PSSSSPRFRPYASPTHHVIKSRYITSNDPRGYIPVYEYPLNGQWIMMDVDDGYILWTGIWKALGNSKADIVKMIESQPDLASQIRRVRGGYLKIQGTWMPYEVALRLSRRVAWPIRHDLVPLFGYVIWNNMTSVLPSHSITS